MRFRYVSISESVGEFGLDEEEFDGTPKDGDHEGGTLEGTCLFEFCLGGKYC